MPETAPDLTYWAHALDLVADALLELKPEDLAARAPKMVAILRNAAFWARAGER